jgi:hypothetical protein
MSCLVPGDIWQRDPESGRWICAHCEELLATCVGSYEEGAEETPACDECCGHGNEDGRCKPIPEAYRPAKRRTP